MEAKLEAAAVAEEAAGTETDGLLGQQHGSEGSPEVRASCLSMQLWGGPLGGRGWL